MRVADLGFAGAEALLAGALPDGTRVSPTRIVEAARLLPQGSSRLTDFVLRRAIRAAVAWHAHGLVGPVSVNLPFEALIAPGAVASFERTLREAGISPRQVVFELLEDGFYDDSADALGILTKLRLAGFGLALDDLGRRQSGLLQLANLPVTEIKIDRDIIRQARVWDKARATSSARSPPSVTDWASSSRRRGWRPLKTWHSYAVTPLTTFRDSSWRPGGR